jgi:hypothetical protein
MGFRSPVSRSTLADANGTRDWRIYAEFAQLLIQIARVLQAAQQSASSIRRGTQQQDPRPSNPAPTV